MGSRVSRVYKSLLSLSMTILIILITVILLPTQAKAQSNPHFSDFKSPVLSGERQASALIDFKGVPKSKMNVYLVYSDSRDEVVNAFNARQRTGRESLGTARCITLSPFDPQQTDKYRCSFVFPHSVHRTPNIEDRRAKVFRPGSRIYYAWAKSWIPTSMTEELTLNSSIQEFVMPRPASIALLGDSFSSGEGAPNRTLKRPLGGGSLVGVGVTALLDNGEGMWDDVVCHRSKYGGLQQGVERLINSTPIFEFDYINVTCSGATVGEGLISGQFVADQTIPPIDSSNRKPGGSKTGQVRQVLDWLDKKKYPVLDALVMSVGGNDVGFDWVVTTCMAGILSNCAEDVKAVSGEALKDLPSDYEALNNALISQFQEKRKAISEVFITEYPDPTNGADGKPCSSGLTRGAGNPFDCWGLLEAQVSPEDFTFLKEKILGGLNSAVYATEAKFGWNIIKGMLEASKTFGLCNCENGFFNTFGQSDYIQGDLYGSVHPNQRGYTATYAPAVASNLSLYFTNRRGLGLDQDNEQVSGFSALRAKPVQASPNRIKYFAETKLKSQLQKPQVQRELRPIQLPERSQELQPQIQLPRSPQELQPQIQLPISTQR